MSVVKLSMYIVMQTGLHWTGLVRVSALDCQKIGLPVKKLVQLGWIAIQTGPSFLHNTLGAGTIQRHGRHWFEVIQS